MGDPSGPGRAVRVALVDSATMPGFSTRAIKAASRVPDVPQAPVNVPIYATSTFEVSDATELAELLEFTRPGHSYSRYSNPTHDALELALAELEGGEAGLVTASGMAAIFAVMLSILRAGDEVVIPHAVYGGTIGLARSVLDRSGIRHRTVDPTDAGAVEAAIDGGAKLLWLETISNPTTAMGDVATLAELAHAHGVLVGVDNTFASPALANPLGLGADIVVHSTTKYIGGHSDLMGGAVVGPADRVAAARHVMLNAGGNASPWEAFLALRGLKTLALRMERHCTSALKIATWLERNPKVRRVYYPGLPSHPQHALAKKQMHAFGGMISAELEGTLDDARRFLERCQLFALAESLGGVESLIEHPALMTHGSVPVDVRAALGISDTLVRLSVGIEDPDDLIADLDAALG